ncbi:leucine-rich repeat domain-containing protein [Hymenobacter sp. BT635]|uniref:Leucine-rich repeat domain-containing protein n=1 Tax=Hymenobacter nitidus TaxID=2880929 RepID=A0ABS8AGZ2_9BACT|nr:leucine-rich repeat domain-containing protein [Hymenobacter nitidus]MCB2378485.1 leucine-rich repeat domain-containing protein [Hymenobacter nitidus]
MYWKSIVWLAVSGLTMAVSCKPLKRVYRRTIHWQQTQTQTQYLQRADIIGGTELDSGRFDVLHYSYSSNRPHISDTWYSKEIFLRIKQLSDLQVGQAMQVPNAVFSVIGYDRATWHFEQFGSITGTITRLHSSATQPRLRFDLQYIDWKKRQQRLLQGIFTFRLDSTYFLRTRQDFHGQYEDLRLALKEPAKVKSLDLTTYAIQYEKRNGQDSGPDTLYSRLGELYNLDSLRLHLSHLQRLPDGFEKLKRLKRLDLSYNQLTEFPTVLYQLDSLQELNLEWNRLDSIPIAIRQMKGLRVLNLNDNHLGRYPEAVNELTGLRELHLGNANLRALPTSMSRLQRLEVIEVNSFWNSKRKNQVTNIDALVSLPRLRRLSLKDNPLDSLPTAVYQLKQLEELNIQYTGLDSAAVDLRRLPKLKKLELQ